PLYSLRARLPLSVLHGRLCKAHEKRRRSQGTARELGVRLGPHEEWMHVLRQFKHLHDRLGWVLAAEDHAMLFEDRDVLGIDLVPVAEPKADARRVVVKLAGE